MPKEMSIEKDIEFLEKMVKKYKTFGDLDNPDYEETERIYKAIETVLAELERTKNVPANDTVNVPVILAREYLKLKQDYIPKSVVIEKREELKEEYKKAIEENSTKAFILKCQIEILEQLLQESEEK